MGEIPLIIVTDLTEGSEVIPHHPVRPEAITPLRSYHSLSSLSLSPHTTRHEHIPLIPPPARRVRSSNFRPKDALELLVLQHHDFKDGSSLWLMARQPGQGRITHMIADGMNVRIGDSKRASWVDGTVGKLVSLEKKWVIYEFLPKNARTSEMMQLAVPRPWGHLQPLTAITYALAIPFLPNTLPTPKQVYSQAVADQESARLNDGVFDDDE